MLYFPLLIFNLWLTRRALLLKLCSLWTCERHAISWLPFFFSFALLNFGSIHSEHDSTQGRMQRGARVMQHCILHSTCSG